VVVVVVVAVHGAVVMPVKSTHVLRSLLT